MPDSRAHILIVDDDDVFVSDLGLLLKKLFVVSRTKGTDGLADVLKNDPPDLVILDLWLEDGKTGFDALEILQSVQPDTPSVMISDRPSLPLVVEAIRRGVFAFLKKSASLEEITATIKRALDESTKNSSKD